MRVLTEVIEEKQKILIVSKSEPEFNENLKKELSRFGGDIFISPQLPNNLSRFDMCIIVNNLRLYEEASTLGFKKLVFIVFENDRISGRHKIEHFKKNIKIIHIAGSSVRPEDFDRLFWFIFSQSDENELTLHVAKTGALTKKTEAENSPRPMKKIKIPSIKRIVIIGFLIILLFHLAFVPSLMLASFHFYRSFQFLKTEQIQKAIDKKDQAEKELTLSKKFYSYVRPTYLMASLALPIDSLFDLNDSAYSILGIGINLYDEGKELLQLVFKKNKSKIETERVASLFSLLQNQTASLNTSLLSLNQRLPFTNTAQIKKIKSETLIASDMLTKIQKLLPFSGELLGKSGTKKYLILFANNMELRPGGGFIGSFGILKTHDYTIDEIQIYDVYDADGQLTTHVDPPDAIRKYLQQPHFFLRDSAFSPDFIENAKTAETFLEREMSMDGFDGTFLLTTTSIQNLLGAFGTIYLPDFNEKVNQENFYLKAQIHSEKDFFPGSIQKKNFLGTLARYLFLHAEDVSIKDLAIELQTSLDEKQIVASFKNEQIQNLFDTSYWSGRVIQPECTNSPNCISDYLFPYDANLGVNKANFFVKRSTILETNIKTDGSVHHVLSTTYENESTGDVFPGGTYKNYLQLLLPTNSVIEEVTNNGTLVDNVDDLPSDRFKKIGFYFMVEPKKTAKITITYRLINTFSKGKGLYQLVVQKQIGSANSDLNLLIKTGNNTTVLNQNFSPLVNNGQFVYNTVLTSDKIFFVDLIRE